MTYTSRSTRNPSHPDSIPSLPITEGVVNAVMLIYQLPTPSLIHVAAGCAQRSDADLSPPHPLPLPPPHPLFLLNQNLKTVGHAGGQNHLANARA